MSYVMTALFALLGGIAIGGFIEQELVTGRTILQMRVQAVERGFADWQVDPKTGKTTFQWRDRDLTSYPQPQRTHP